MEISGSEEVLLENGKTSGQEEEPHIGEVAKMGGIVLSTKEGKLDHTH